MPVSDLAVESRLDELEREGFILIEGALTPEVTEASPLPEQATLLDLGEHLGRLEF